MLGYRTKFAPEHLKSLNPGCWLEDQIIAISFEYFEVKLFAKFDSLRFVTPGVSMLIMHERDMEDLQDTIKGCRLTGQQFVFFPINDTSVNSVNGDSIPGSSNKVFASQLVKQLAPFLNAPQGEQESSTGGGDGGRGGKTKKRAKGQQTGSSVVSVAPQMKEVKCTRQANAFDCGMHTVCHAEALVQLLAEQPNLLLSDPAVVAALNKKMSAVAVADRRKTLKEELLQFEHKD